MTANPDDGDAGHATETYIATEPERWAANVPVSQQESGYKGWAEASLLLGVSSRVGG
jgi:hypothetical protein